MSSIFGGAANNSSGGGTFGSSTNQTTNTGAGLFGSAPAQNTSNASTAGGLFGSTPAQNASTASTGGGLFGSTLTPAQNNNTSNTGGGLFGSSSALNNKPASGGLFGSAQTQPTTTASGGLFGKSTGTPSLFGGGNQNQSQNQSNANNTQSVFGNSQATTSNQNATSSLFGAGPSQQRPMQPGFNASTFNPQTVTVGTQGHSMTHAQLQRLQLSGASTVPNEKNITKQIITVKEKWSPEIPQNLPPDADPTPKTVLKTYLYNAAPKEYAPFFYPDRNRGEDEKSWEEALAQKPELPKIDGKDISTLAYVPILCTGFKALGERVQTQAQIVQEMRTRLHEMNNSLSAIMDAHQQRITVKIAAAKRQHQVLSQRCLKLAVKVQVLRNRGYALDAQEESLRRTLLSLEKQVTDPGFTGREDEIWARMMVLRERARWLEAEGKRMSAQVNETNQQAAPGERKGLPEEVLAKTRKILKDYDGQLQHLNKELEDVKKEYAEWEETQRRR